MRWRSLTRHWPGTATPDRSGTIRTEGRRPRKRRTSIAMVVDCRRRVHSDLVARIATHLDRGTSPAGRSPQNCPGSPRKRHVSSARAENLAQAVTGWRRCSWRRLAGASPLPGRRRSCTTRGRPRPSRTPAEQSGCRATRPRAPRASGRTTAASQPAIALPASLAYSAIPAGILDVLGDDDVTLGHSNLLDYRRFRRWLVRGSWRWRLWPHLQPGGDLFGIGDRPTVVGHLEDLGAQGQAHAMAGTAFLVDGDLHRRPPLRSNSRCSSVRPRRM